MSAVGWREEILWLRFKGRTGVDSTEDVGLDFLIAILFKVVDEGAEALDGVEGGCIVARESLLGLGVRIVDQDRTRKVVLYHDHRRGRGRKPRSAFLGSHYRTRDNEVELRVGVVRVDTDGNPVLRAI
jgi:hypothetical protein